MRSFDQNKISIGLLVLLAAGAILWIPNEMRRMQAGRCYLNGLRAVQSGRYGEAIPQFERARRLVPAQPLFAFAEGYTCSLSSGDVSTSDTVFMHREQYAKTSTLAKCAVLCLRDAVRLQPNDAMFHEDYGWALLASGYPKLASAEFGQAVALEPEDPLYLMELGLDSERVGNAPEAYRLYGRAVAASPSVLDSAFFTALRIRSPQGANSAIALGLQLSTGDSPISLAQHARILIEMQRIGQAHADLIKALAGVQNLSMAWLNLGRIANDASNAEDYYKRAYAIDPDNVSVMQQLASSALTKGDTQSATNLETRILLTPAWTEHAKRSYLLYGLQSVAPNDGLPRILLEYISPDRHVPETCQELHELLHEQGKPINENLSEKLRAAGNPCE